MKKILTLLFLWGAPAAAQTVSCEDIVPLTAYSSELSRAYSTLTRWCIDNGPTQPACLELARQTKEKDLQSLSVAAATSILAFGVRCGKN